ncbi:MAG TPA: hypothetical protein VIN04_07410 [Myxococcota bacterium]
MRRLLITLGVLGGLAAAYLVAHWALIEVGREVVVLRTQEPGGGWLETRLWVVDDEGVPTLHGADSGWMRNLKERPVVEMTRGGVTHRYRAVPVPGPHPRVHELLRAKYGIADRWVRFVAPDDEHAMPVRLERLPDS